MSTSEALATTGEVLKGTGKALKTTWMRDALAWFTQTQDSTVQTGRSVYEWLWEAVQGDFSEDRSTGQIAFDAAISFIPLVDQVCDVRDLIANCRKIKQDPSDSWNWVCLGLTLIGLFPSLGSLIKGVLKIAFVFVRRHGFDRMTQALHWAMPWVITFLRKREVQACLRFIHVDEVFGWLAGNVRVVRGRVNKAALLAAFDTGVNTLQALFDKVDWLPGAAEKAKATLKLVAEVRQLADTHMAEAVAPLQKILDAFALRLEREAIVARAAVHSTNNIHFRGTLPPASAVSLMRQADPPPAWLSKGTKGKFPGLKPEDEGARKALDKARRLATVEAETKAMQRGVPAWQVQVEPWPELDKKTNIPSFHKLAPDVIVGPAKLYRIGSPSSGAMGDCWVSEKVFYDLMNAPDPKAAWRKYLAVWPDWNANGQFFIHEIPAGQKLKVWRGEASSQIKADMPDLDAHLEGGWEQVIFKPTKENGAKWDTMSVYERSSDGQLKPSTLSFNDYRNLPADKQASYVPIREKINDPHTTGPFDTGWGMTDFDQQLSDVRIGLPTLPGQVTNP